MKVGIDSYCFHRYFGEVYEGLQRPAGATWDVFDFLSFAESLGVRNVSLETCFMPALDGPFVDQLRQRLDEGGFERVLAWGHPSGLEGGTKREALEELRWLIPRARRLGVDVVRFVGGSGETGRLPHEPQIRTLVEWLRDVCRTAAEHQVVLAMENHNDFTSEEMLQIVEGVGSESLRVNLDTGNMLRVCEDPVAGARRLARYTAATHIKDVAVDPNGGGPRDFAFWPSCPIGQGVVAIPEIIAAFKSAGYAGALTVEIDLVHPRWAHVPEETLVRESVAYLRQALADAN